MSKKASMVAAVFISSVVFVSLGVAYSQSLFAIVAPPLPEIISISPATGPVAGGTIVTLTGTGFTQNAIVLFGTTQAIIQSITDTTIIVNSPALSAGVVDIKVNDINGNAVLPSSYTYTEVVVEPINICKGKKVSVCHLPPGNIENPQDLCLPESAIPSHLAHGDYLGICK